MNLNKIKKHVLWFIGDLLLKRSVTFLCRTVKLNLVNQEKVHSLIKEGKPFIAAFWHGSMLMPWFFFRNKRFGALVSPSRDGELLTGLLKHWGYHVVRGSSSKNSGDVLLRLVEIIEGGNTLTITPDGPTGPPHELKAGAVIAAQRAVVPLVLIGVGINRKRILSSWDSFEVPKFFSRANLIFSDPIVIEQNLAREETSQKIVECESLLNSLQERAQKFD